MKLRNTAILLTCTLFAAMLTGCSSEEPAASQAEEIQQTAAETESSTEAVTRGRIHINVETVEISLAELKEQDYVVSVVVTLEENAGVNYTEWGLSVDDRCALAVGKSDEALAMTVYHAINEEQNFLWTAWASAGDPNEETGPILVLDITIPEDAKSGDFYTVDYADWSLADKAHVWSSDDNDWGENGDVSWADGGIAISE